MKHTALTTLAALLAAATGAFTATSPTPMRYDVVEAKRSVVHEAQSGDRDLAVGDRVDGGELVRTGWWSEADLEVEARAAHFHLDSRTRVRLASDEPGVLLELERGRVRAVFDRFDGSDDVERAVATPSAVLAVRGTHYGVSVDSHGDCELVVFEGVVEVRDRTGVEAPVQVTARHAMRIRAGQPFEPPRPHGIDPLGWDRGQSMSSYGHGSPGPGPGPGEPGMTDAPRPGPGPGGSATGSGHGRG
jgi:hypothetical protein